MSWSPDWVVAPGEVLQEWMDENGLNARLLARSAAVGADRIEGVLKKKPLRRVTAEALERATGIPTSFWEALEKNYRYGLARGKKDEGQS